MNSPKTLLTWIKMFMRTICFGKFLILAQKQNTLK